MGMAKLKSIAIGLFYIMALVGILDMSYQATMQTRCGPIKKVLTALFPNSPGAVICRECKEVDSE